MLDSAEGREAFVMEEIDKVFDIISGWNCTFGAPLKSFLKALYYNQGTTGSMRIDNMTVDVDFFNDYVQGLIVSKEGWAVTFYWDLTPQESHIKTLVFK